jgi:NAD(P)-dependent dehydrogenase (short-subunit alcohol dehydrogenase family)
MDQKKVMLVTGASGALGSNIVKYFAQYFVVIAQYNSNLTGVPINENIIPMQCDLFVESEIQLMIEKIKSQFGRIDFVINNAGISNSSISWKTELEQWNATLAINLTAPFLVSKYAIPIMRSQNEGAIISISSVVGQIGEVGTSAYAASKSGLFGLTKTLAKELANFKITVNCIALGYFNTGMIDQLSHEQQSGTVAQIPLKEFGNPDTLVYTIAYLIGEGGKYSTGQIINLNGGLYS